MGNARSKAAVRAIDSAYSEPLLGERRLQAAAETETEIETEAEALAVPLRAVVRQLDSFYAVLWPVATAMILTSMAVCLLSDPQTARAMRYVAETPPLRQPTWQLLTAAAASSYMPFQEASASPARKSLAALGNALLVVLVVALLTFGLALLYKLDGMRLFLGYSVAYSGALLGVAGGRLVVLALGRAVALDRLALAFVMYNFAAVGVLAIFYQRGIPSAVERGYLVVTSVIVAWQLAQLPPWSAWTLLLLLACWDLFAVLSPVGPLRWLVDLVHEKGTPLPGLLFQADVSDAHSLRAEAGVDADADAHAARSVQEGRTKLAATPEDAFLRRLLAAGDAGAAKASGESLARPLRAFLRDQRSTLESRAADLARAFATDPARLWRNLYAFFDVRYVPASRPYPPPRRVFPIAGEHLDGRSIKLGLGDFIFYSVLAARAAAHSFAAFVACSVAVLVGLAITLQMLTRFDALPALPVSVFVGVAVYLFTAATASPMLAHLAAHGVLM